MLWKEIGTKEVKPDLPAYNVRVMHKALLGKSDEILDLFVEMEVVGLEPSPRRWSTPQRGPGSPRPKALANLTILMLDEKEAPSFGGSSILLYHCNHSFGRFVKEPPPQHVRSTLSDASLRRFFLSYFHSFFSFFPSSFRRFSAGFVSLLFFHFSFLFLHSKDFDSVRISFPPQSAPRRKHSIKVLQNPACFLVFLQ